jgi:hypothetical protein
MEAHAAQASDGSQAFVPARDAELSKRFYADLGFINWSTEQIAELQIGSYRFLLQILRC